MSRRGLSRPRASRSRSVRQYAIGADGANGISRDAIGARYQGGSGVLPNVSITFRSRALEVRELCAHGIHYWVIGRTRGGLMGRLDLSGTWWAIVQGVADADRVDPVTLVRDLCGDHIDVDVRATDPWSARTLLTDRYAGRRIFLVGDAAHLNPPWGGHGFNTGVGGLRFILQRLGISKFFAEIFISSEIGADKPDPKIFRRALKLIDLKPNEVLHVGDDQKGIGKQPAPPVCRSFDWIAQRILCAIC